MTKEAMLTFQYPAFRRLIFSGSMDFQSYKIASRVRRITNDSITRSYLPPGNQPKLTVGILCPYAISKLKYSMKPWITINIVWTLTDNAVSFTNMCFVPRINQKNGQLVFMIRPQYQYQHKFVNKVEFEKCTASQAQSQTGSRST